MAAEQPETQASFLKMSARFYRKTFKRVAVFHRAIHWLSRHIFFPLLEQIQDFRTMPDDPFWFRFELLTGRHERETVATLRSLIKPDMTVLDIGGHVGYYTRMASNLVGENGRVIAFEPHPRNHATLKRNIANRKNVTVLQVAVTEDEGIAELHDYLMMSASGSLHYDESLRQLQLTARSAGDFAPRLEGNFQPQTYTVRTAPVDDLLAELNIARVNVVKMDIEGAEMGALRGMKRTISHSPDLALVMEYNPLGLKAFGNDPLDSLREVLAMGFSSLQVIEADGRLSDYTHDFDNLETLTESLRKRMGVVNLLLRR